MLTPEAAWSRIKAGHLVPLYLFCGEESYFREQLLSGLARIFLGPAARLGLEKVDGAQFPLEQALTRLENRNLFSSRQILVIDSPPGLSPSREKQSDAGGEERAGELLNRFLEQERRRPQPERILVFSADKVDRRGRLFKLVSEEGLVVDCAPLKGEALKRWLLRKVKAAGKEMEREAVEQLLQGREGDLWALSHELEKLVCYLGEEKLITGEMVAKLSPGSVEGDVFKLTDSLGAGDLGRALTVLRFLVQRRESPLLILFMIARHFRLLLQYRSLLEEGFPPARAASELKLAPFIARKIHSQALAFDREVLEEILIRLQEIDEKIKTGRLDQQLALELVLAWITRRHKKSAL